MLELLDTTATTPSPLAVVEETGEEGEGEGEGEEKKEEEMVEHHPPPSPMIPQAAAVRGIPTEPLPEEDSVAPVGDISVFPSLPPFSGCSSI